MTRNGKEFKGICGQETHSREPHRENDCPSLAIAGGEGASYVYHWVYPVEPGAAFCQHTEVHGPTFHISSEPKRLHLDSVVPDVLGPRLKFAG